MPSPRWRMLWPQLPSGSASPRAASPLPTLPGPSRSPPPPTLPGSVPSTQGEGTIASEAPSETTGHPGAGLGGWEQGWTLPLQRSRGGNWDGRGCRGWFWPSTGPAPAELKQSPRKEGRAASPLQPLRSPRRKEEEGRRVKRWWIICRRT